MDSMADEKPVSVKEGGKGLIAEARKEFERCRDAESDNRQTAIDDIKFALLEEQWPETIRKQREQDHRPILTINKLPAFIRQVVNDARQNKPSVTVAPVDSNGDPETAEVLTGLIRNIEYTSNADVAYDTAIEQAVASGFGYWRVNIGHAYQDSFDLDITIDRIVNQFSVYGDPDSTAADSSDWDVCFVTDRISKAAFKRKYKGKADVDFEGDGWAECKDTAWLNDEGVLIAEWWTRTDVPKKIVKLSDGRVVDAADIDEDTQAMIDAGSIVIEGQKDIIGKKVKQTIISGAEVLEEHEHPGCYIPIIPVYGSEILVQGKRYFRSLIHSAIDAQRNFNFWRTASTELIALAPRVPYIGEEGAFDADPNWAQSNKASIPFLEYSEGQQPPQRQPLDVGPAASAIQEALTASDDIKAIIGMYDASLGQRSNETSGKAIMARQREGDVATFHFIDNLTRAIRHTGRVVVDLIPKVYSGARVVRVLGEDGEAKPVPVNQEYEKTMQDGGQVEEGSEVNDMQQAAMAMHDLSVGKYDVVVKSGPSFTTRRQESAEQMMQMIQAFPQAAAVIGPELAKNLDWPGADDIAEKLEKMVNPPEAQIPPEVQQQIAEGQALLEKTMAENEQLKMDQTAQAQKVQGEMQLKQMQLQAEMAFERQKFEQQMQLERYKIEKQAELQRYKVETEAQVKSLATLANMPSQESLSQG